jgi:hypothetical protein
VTASVIVESGFKWGSVTFWACFQSGFQHPSYRWRRNDGVPKFGVC